jgi:hypothetical protein
MQRDTGEATRSLAAVSGLSWLCRCRRTSFKLTHPVSGITELCRVGAPGSGQRPPMAGAARPGLSLSR